MKTRDVTIDADRCDGCWACVRSCPTAALVSEFEASSARISWSAARCVYCGRCETVCPQHAVRRAPSAGPSGARDESGVLVVLTPWTCAHCGAPFGAGPRRDHGEDALRAIDAGRGRLCPRCRQREAFRSGLVGRGEGERC